MIISLLIALSHAQAAHAFTVTDMHGAPISNAQVYLDESPLPLTQNLSVVGSRAVTIEAPGYIRTTYLEPQSDELKIREIQIEATPVSYELKGNSNGFGNLDNDGTFDLGLVVQAVPRASLSSISLQSLISPQTDHFTVLGQSVDIPSNITLPDQSESYGWIPLSFNKPAYRLYLPTQGAWQIAALHAQVPFKKTIDALQGGKSMFDIVNTFNFVEGSVIPVTLNGASTSKDVSVNQTRYSKSIKFTAPTFDASLNLLTIALANTNDAYYPTDIKNVASGSTVQLSAPPQAAQDGMILAAYKKAGSKTVGPEADQYSAVTLPNAEQRPFDPIRLVNPPQVSGNQLVLDTPTAGADLNPIMTYGSLSIVTRITQGKLNIETKSPQWDVWAPNWVNKLDLPQRPLPTIDKSTQSLRWEVGFNAQFVGQKSLPPGPDELSKITHVSRSAVDL